jgi:ferritin-like protein
MAQAIFSAPRKLEFDCRAARDFLSQAELSPCSAAQLLDTYFDQMERSGFLGA